METTNIIKITNTKEVACGLCGSWLMNDKVEKCDMCGAYIHPDIPPVIMEEREIIKA